MSSPLLTATALLLAFSHSASAYNYSTGSDHCDDIWDFTGDAGLEAPTKVTQQVGQLQHIVL